MLNRKTTAALIAFTLVLGSASETRAQTGNCEPALGEAYLDINNVRARILNNGNLFWRGAPPVYEVPKGGGANAIFVSGIWVGGYVGGQLRVAAARYSNYQFWGGPLDDNGAPPADCADFDRLYKVSRTDIDEYESTGVAAPDVRDWPTGLGAPTLARPENGEDDDGDGEVDEEGEQLLFDINVPLAQRADRVVNLALGERPAILGDQSIWWVMNDRGNEHLATGGDTPPIGLEVHVLAFAFNTAGDIGNTTFYKYDMYAKGAEPLTDTYIGLFSDPDLGNFQDDWVGSDTARGMGYVWNSDNDDEGGDGYGIPPAAGYDFFQGPIVPSLGDTAYVSGAARPDFKNLEMTHFVYYNNGPGPAGDPENGPDYYNFLSGHWKDGQRITLGGNGRDFSDTPTDYMFPGDPGSSDSACQYWSECNADGAGTDIEAADRRFAMSTGPFTINPGDYQQIVFGIVWAQGENNFDSVQKLKIADGLAQAAFDVDFALPSPPAAPGVTATALDREVILEWSNSARSNNYLETYQAEDPFAPEGSDIYVFEGYTVIQYESASDQIGKVIGNYDTPNGVTRVIDGIPGEPTMVTAVGSDNGTQSYHSITGLVNYTTYFFGVQAYAFNDFSTPKIYRGPIKRVEVIPTRSPKVISDAARDAAADPGADFQAEKTGIGDGSVWANIVNPANVAVGAYSVEFYALEGGSAAAKVAPFIEDEIDALDDIDVAAKNINDHHITYDVKRDGTVIFDGSATGEPAPQRPGVVLADGMEFSIVGPSPGFKDFLTVSNAAGVLDPPENAAFGWLGFPSSLGLGSADRERQQSIVASRWGINAGGSGGAYGPQSDGGSFLGRAMRGNNLANAGVFDYEMRFTQECVDGIDGNAELSDCLAYRRFEDGEIIEVPFQLWQTGVATPDDTSDDVLMVAAICDTDACGGGTEQGVYDIGGDHEASGGPDDPFSDWIYWLRPSDDAPGRSGHDRFYGGESIDLTEVIARSVLVVHNGGAAPPYNPALPEAGTTFRIVTSKPNQPGDVHVFSTVGFGAEDPSNAVLQDRLDNIGIVPNPYLGASAYEVSQLTDEVRFTNMPDVATIRVFTLNGTLIKTLEKQSPGVATIAWNLTTDYNLPVASGVYLVHVEVPDVGSKVIKLGVVKKRTQLNVF